MACFSRYDLPTLFIRIGPRSFGAHQHCRTSVPQPYRHAHRWIGALLVKMGHFIRLFMAMIVQRKAGPLLCDLGATTSSFVACSPTVSYPMPMNFGSPFTSPTRPTVLDRTDQGLHTAQLPVGTPAQRSLRWTPLLVSIVFTTVLVAMIDLFTSATFNGSALYTLPLALCALQRSKKLLWIIAVAVAVLTLVSGNWGLDRHGSLELRSVLVNDALLVASLFTLAGFIHLFMEGSRKSVLDAIRMQFQSDNLLFQNVQMEQLIDSSGKEIIARQESEADLEQMEVKYRGLLEAAPDAMVVVDEQGKIVLLNVQAEKQFGYRRDELLGKHVTTIIPEGFAERLIADDKRSAAEALAQHMGTGIELVALRKDGSEFPIEMMLSPLVNKEGILVTAAIRDISVRRKAVEHLAQMESRYRGLLEAAPDAMVVVNEQGAIVLLNVQAEKQFGYWRGELLGKRVTDIIPEGFAERLIADDKRSAAEALAQHMGTGIELVALRKDGSEFPIEMMLSPLVNKEGILVTAAIRDISVRKRKEQESRWMEERFQRLLESAPDAMVIVDREGVIQLANAQAELVFGYAKHEMLGQPVVMLITSNLLGTAAHQEAHLGRDPRTRMMGHGIELEGKRKNGSQFPLEAALSPLDLVDGMLVSVAVRDITDRKRAENDILELNRTLEQRVSRRTEQLLKSEQRFHNALDIMLEGVQIIGFDWTHLYVNDAVVAQSTFSREELIGHTMLARYPGIEQSPLFVALAQCMEQREAHIMDTDFTFPNGSVTSFHLSIQPVDEGLLILSSDITAKKRAESEVAIQREQLERQNKDLEQFAYIASHDLKEPLRMVTSYVQLLQQRYSDKLDEVAMEYIAFAVDGAERMKQLITDLLGYSQLGRALTTGDVDLDVVVQHVRSNLAHVLAESKCTLTIGALPVVRSSSTEMLQLFQNLVSNAIKFRRNDVVLQIHVSATEEKEHWHFKVEDNGIGIEQRYHDIVFTPFKRLNDKSRYTGSGIGLSIAQKVVLVHGGRIWITSTFGLGTTIHFTLKRK